MKLKNVTTYDQKAIRALNLMSIKTSRRWKSLLLRVLGAVWAGSLLFNAYFLGANVLGILDALLGVVVLLWVFFLNYNSAWAVVRGMGGAKQYTAVFQEECYTLSDGAQEIQIPYSEVHAVYEDRDYCFFMQNTRQGHVFSKKGFQGEAYETFRNFVQEKFGTVSAM